MPSRLYLLIAALLLPFSSGVSAEPTEGVPVVVGSVQQQAIYREVRVTGSVTSPQVASLSPSTAGLVQAVHADAGDRVAAGDVLLELDDELAQLRWRSAEAERAQAATALDDAARRLAEAQKLAPQQSIAETAVRALEAEVAGDRAALERATADAQYQHALLARHQLRAPFAGVISRKLSAPGEWVAQGAGVFELVATDGLRLDFAVSEDYLSALQPDTEVEFSLSAHPGERYAGRVQAIVPVTDPGARTFLLRVLPSDDDTPMLPGMSAHASLRIADNSIGLAVPRDATLNYQDGRVVVWTVEDEEQGSVARERAVQPGATFDGMVEVRDGLPPDARIVIQGNEALSDGQRVRIIEPL